MRVVFDTNFYLAATKPGNYSEDWIKIASKPLLSPYKIITSPQILQEVQDKLENKFGFSRADAVDYINGISKVASVVNPKIKLDVIKLDPDDNKILECAVEGDAHLIVSMDRHLLKLKKYEKIGIVHPSDLKHIFPTP